MKSFTFECNLCGKIFVLKLKGKSSEIVFCPFCGKKDVHRLWQIDKLSGVHFTGKGFYSTDKGKHNESNNG